MKTQSRVTKLIAIAIALVAVTGAWAAWGGNRANAAGTFLTPEPFGLASGQTARLNAAYVIDPARGLARAPESVQVELEFFDGEGRVLERSTRTLALNKTVFEDHAYADVPGRQGRVPIRASVKVMSVFAWGWRDTVPPLNSTLELFNANGDTAALLPAVQKCMSISSVLGIVRGQTARLNVAFLLDPTQGFARPPEPIQVDLLFFDVDGRTLKRSTKLVAPDKAVFEELSFEELSAREGERVQIRALVRLSARFWGNDSGNWAPLPVSLVATLETYNNATGITSAIAMPPVHLQ